MINKSKEICPIWSYSTFLPFVAAEYQKIETLRKLEFDEKMMLKMEKCFK
jgi:hypothetical protein